MLGTILVPALQKTSWLFFGYPGCRQTGETMDTLITLRTSVRELPAWTKSIEVPHCNFEVHL